jgi:hypothetical protein
MAGVGWQTRAQLGWVDGARNAFETALEVSGFVRSFCFVGDKYAAVAVSIPPDSPEYASLPVRQSKTRPTCGVFIADLERGEMIHSVTFLGKNAREIHGIVAMPGARRPALLPFHGDAVQHTVTVGEMQNI